MGRAETKGNMTPPPSSALRISASVCCSRLQVWVVLLVVLLMTVCACVGVVAVPSNTATLAEMKNSHGETTYTQGEGSISGSSSSSVGVVTHIHTEPTFSETTPENSDDDNPTQTSSQLIKAQKNLRKNTVVVQYSRCCPLKHS